MTEKDYSTNNISNENKGKRKPVGTLVLTMILVLAMLVVFIFINSGLAARTGESVEDMPPNTAAAGTGGCCRSDNTVPADTDPLAQAAIDYYRESGGDISGIQAVVDDFGCHQEVSLIRDGEIVKRYSYAGSNLVDITP